MNDAEKIAEISRLYAEVGAIARWVKTNGRLPITRAQYTKRAVHQPRMVSISMTDQYPGGSWQIIVDTFGIASFSSLQLGRIDGTIVARYDPTRRRCIFISDELIVIPSPEKTCAILVGKHKVDFEKLFSLLEIGMDHKDAIRLCVTPSGTWTKWRLVDETG